VCVCILELLQLFKFVLLYLRLGANGAIFCKVFDIVVVVVAVAVVASSLGGIFMKICFRK
jgi:hypothetical protein